ncbi:MAG TPA: Sua5 family C-terminal domain-containing protein, partial [Bacillales bacterium]|nr:Sua5 family C-terminal domain-containing protein [Bacillales bacterium]
GMKYRHYAPQAVVTLVDGGQAFLQSLVDSERRKGKKVGVLTTEERKNGYDADAVVSCGRRDDLHTVARGLYAALREFDEHDVDLVFAETYSADGVGEAVMNRLEKSAGGRIICE